MTIEAMIKQYAAKFDSRLAHDLKITFDKKARHDYHVHGNEAVVTIIFAPLRKDNSKLVIDHALQAAVLIRRNQTSASEINGSV